MSGWPAGLPKSLRMQWLLAPSHVELALATCLLFRWLGKLTRNSQ